MKHMSFANVSTVAGGVPERLLLHGWLALPLRCRISACDDCFD
jgi:hypothetical protein